MNPTRIGVIGCGYWGPNHIRNFHALGGAGAAIVSAADRDAGRREHVAELYPDLQLVADGQALIDDPTIDALVVATPAPTHHALARAAIQAGKHVLIEKPFVLDAEHGDELNRLAREHERVLMVGHTFLYTAAVNHIRDLIASDGIGDVQYVRSQRVNLGLFQKDINVMWDLAPHDVSILLYILDRPPTHVSATGNWHVTQGVEDVVVLTIEFGEALMANIIVSWLDPRKVREMTVVGKRKMLVYDDLSSNEKIRVYDKGVEVPPHYDSFGEFQYAYRFGDIVIPRLDEHEPLRGMCRHFLDCIRKGATPRSSGESAAQVTRILCAADRSLRAGGGRIALDQRRE